MDAREESGSRKRWERNCFSMKTTLCFALISVAIFSGCGTRESIELFDGETLTGWRNFGGGDFYIEDGAIVGRAAPDLPNSFLATEEKYDDFELNLEFKVHPLLNSGIQIRSNVYPEETRTIRWGGRFDESGGKILQDKVWEAGRFWGYQVEIDPTERAWSGALYEEGGRGFLHTPGESEAAMKALKPDDWNHFRIVAKGDHFQTWLNGVPVADVKDGLTATGYVALQLHGIGGDKDKIGKTVRWRNIELRKL